MKGLIGPVESPHWFCNASRAHEEIKKEGWLGARMARSIFKKHLCPSELPQKTGSAGILVSLHGGVSLLSSLRLSDSSLCAALHSLLSNKFSPTYHYIWPFFSFSLSRWIFTNTEPSSSHFAVSFFSSSLSPLLFFFFFLVVNGKNIRRCLNIKEALLLPPTNNAVNVSMFVE